MNVNINTSKTFRDQIMDFKIHSKQCIPVIEATGKLIQATFRGKNAPRWAIFCHDILKRIRDNIKFLIDNKPPHSYNSNPLQLIIRSIFSDLLSLSYVVVNLNDISKIDKFLMEYDLSALRGELKYIECEKAFISLYGDSNLQSQFDKKINELNISIDLLNNNLNNNKNKKQVPITLTQIANEFRDNTQYKHLYILLFGPFKLLSQVEHYAIVNRHLSYYEDNLSFFFQKYAISYKSVIDYICAEITSYIQKIDKD